MEFKRTFYYILLVTSTDILLSTLGRFWNVHVSQCIYCCSMVKGSPVWLSVILYIYVMIFYDFCHVHVLKFFIFSSAFLKKFCSFYDGSLNSLNVFKKIKFKSRWVYVFSSNAYHSLSLEKFEVELWNDKIEGRNRINGWMDGWMDEM